MFTATNDNKKVLAKFTNLWDDIKRLIKEINGGKKGKYGKSDLNQMIYL